MENTIQELAYHAAPFQIADPEAWLWVDGNCIWLMFQTDWRSLWNQIKCSSGVLDCLDVAAGQDPDEGINWKDSSVFTEWLSLPEEMEEDIKAGGHYMWRYLLHCSV